MIVTKKRAISIISPGPFIKYITPVAMPQPAIHIKNSKKQGFTLLQRNKRSKPLPISLKGLGMGETLGLWHVGIHFLYPLAQMKDSRPVLGKHMKYKDKYGENEIFWGFGIEIETYLQFAKPVYVATPVLKTARKPERYSVNYYSSYKPETLVQMEHLFPDASGFAPLPLLLNCHSLTKADRHGQHLTTYEKVPKPNPKFSGCTVFEEMQDFCPRLFRDEHEVGFTFDGDTLEFMSEDFYRATAEDAIEDIVMKKKGFLSAFNKFLVDRRVFLDKGPVIYPLRNHPFAIFHTNQRNVGMFNNGTYHVNITLPTRLGKKATDGSPTMKEPAKFKMQHRACIRVYQWLEPLLVAVYGSPDPFQGCSAGSQRGAMSRYIGLGTYDTDAMPEGKIVTVPINQLRGSDQPFWWYKVYHATSGYQSLEQLGMDINYRKHFLHGIELRIFDWFPEERLQELSDVLVYAAQASLLHANVVEPVMNRAWNNLMVGVLREGTAYKPSVEEISYLEFVFLIGLPRTSVGELYKALYSRMMKKYGRGTLSGCFLREKDVSGCSCLSIG
jgi:hypothetical protein